MRVHVCMREREREQIVVLVQLQSFSMHEVGSRGMVINSRKKPMLPFISLNKAFDRVKLEDTKQVCLCLITVISNQLPWEYKWPKLTEWKNWRKLSELALWFLFFYDALCLVPSNISSPIFTYISSNTFS